MWGGGWGARQDMGGGGEGSGRCELREECKKGSGRKSGLEAVLSIQCFSHSNQ